MIGLTRGKLKISIKTLKRMLIAIAIIAFFSFGDYPIYVYTIKVIAIIGLLIISRYIRNDSYLNWILVFFIWCALSYIWAADKDIVISYLVWYLQAILLAYSIGTTVNDRTDIEYILKCIMAGGIILAFRSLRGVSFSSLGTFRLGNNIGYNANEFALKVSLSCIVAFRCFRESDQIIKKIINIVFFLTTLAAMLFSGSRKGILMVAIALFLYCIISSKNPIKLLKNILLAIIGLVIVYMLMTKIEFLYNSFGRRFLLLLNIFDDGSYVGNSIGNRMNAVEIGIDVFKIKPMIGYGLGNYMAATGLRGYAHNNYIQILVDLGIVGIFLYYWFYVRNMVGLITTIKNNRSLTAMLLSMLVGIVVIETGLVSFNSDYVQLVIMLCVNVIRINHRPAAEVNTNT